MVGLNSVGKHYRKPELIMKYVSVEHVMSIVVAARGLWIHLMVRTILKGVCTYWASLLFEVREEMNRPQCSRSSQSMVG